MKAEEILNAIAELSCSQGIYSRMYRWLMETRENNSEEYESVMRELEGKNFRNVVDMVMYFEG